MSKLHIPRLKALHFHHQPAEHWKDSDEMHEVIHSFPGYFKALLLELLDQPMSREEIAEAMRQLETRMAAHHKRDFAKADLDQELAAAVERNVLEEQEGKYILTLGGREMAEHMQAAIPLFFETILSTRIVSIVTIVVHVLLSVFKLAFGFISGSAEENSLRLALATVKGHSSDQGSIRGTIYAAILPTDPENSGIIRHQRIGGLKTWQYTTTFATIHSSVFFSQLAMF